MLQSPTEANVETLFEPELVTNVGLEAEPLNTGLSSTPIPGASNAYRKYPVTLVAVEELFALYVVGTSFLKPVESEETVPVASIPTVVLDRVNVLVPRVREYVSPGLEVPPYFEAPCC